MKHELLDYFSQQYPGPFAYRPCSDGVDDTFDVFCTKTNRTIISSHYWEAEKEAESIAATITHALNRWLD